jgi:hypothetical protein
VDVLGSGPFGYRVAVTTKGRSLATQLSGQISYTAVFIVQPVLKLNIADPPFAVLELAE